MHMDSDDSLMDLTQQTHINYPKLSQINNNRSTNEVFSDESVMDLTQLNENINVINVDNNNNNNSYNNNNNNSNDNIPDELSKKDRKKIINALDKFKTFYLKGNYTQRTVILEFNQETIDKVGMYECFQIRIWIHYHEYCIINRLVS